MEIHEITKIKCLETAELSFIAHYSSCACTMDNRVRIGLEVWLKLDINLFKYHTYVQLTGVIISVTIINNMFVVVRYVMFEFSLLYIKFAKAYTIVFILR